MAQKEAGVTQTHVEMRGDAAPINMLAPPNGVPNPPQHVTPFMIFFSLWIALAGWIFNFDLGSSSSRTTIDCLLMEILGYGGIVLIMPPYKKAFGSCSVVKGAIVCSLTTLQQSLVSVTFLFVAVGGVLGGVTGNYLGRRGTIQCGCLLVAVGAGGMLGTAGSFLSYMVCKCIEGVGLGLLIAAAPVYGAECTAASKRGMLMALYNIGLTMGNAVSSAVCAGSSNYTSNLAWQIPIILQIPLAAILGVGVMMFPESPRWLLIKEKERRARIAFGKFYNKDPDSIEITRQVQEVQYYIELEKANGQTASWTEIYHANDIRRTIASAVILIGLGITGSKFVVPYAALFLQGVGIANPYLVNFYVALCVFGGTFLGPWIVEYGGRRFAMLWGYAGMASCMLTFSAVSSGLGAQSQISKNVLVAFLCIWAFIVGGFIGPSVWIAAPEQHSVRLRTYGQANTVAFYEIFAFAAAFYSPYMINEAYGNMGYNVGYFYFGKLVATIRYFRVLIRYRCHRRTMDSRVFFGP